jgi:hypothetical protein
MLPARPGFVCASVILAATGVYAQQPLASIDGRVEPSGEYVWKVTNNHTSPIVRIEIPHYRADMFMGPDGWSTGESTFLVNIGTPDKPGTLIAQAGGPNSGISRGRSAEFTARLAKGGALRSTGAAMVHFADQRSYRVDGVPISCPEPSGSQYAVSIGFGAIIVLLILHARRRRRRQTSAVSAAGDASAG